MTYEYVPSGVCSRKYTFEIEDNIVKSCKIEGGCPGNLLGISRIIVGMPIDDIVEDFKGVKCGNKDTSCPDQIATALEKFKDHGSN